ncbi:MAG TPA: hypothetical protein DCP63_11350 [Bacteroidetes bacterium]|nr:hypothetical protein [Bacteroidota bacterium]
MSSSNSQSAMGSSTAKNNGSSMQSGMTATSMNRSPSPAGPPSGTERASVSPRSYVPLGQLAVLDIVPGPPMISSENAQLRSIVFLNVRGRDMGGFVEEAKEVLEKELDLPTGYTLQWSGQWENQVRAKQRLTILMPIVLLIIYVMLYLITKDFAEAFVVMLSVPFALIGGVYLIYILGYNFSVAVWVGFIALYGLAVETGVVMVVYLHEALDRKLHAHQAGTRGPITAQDIQDATVEGSVLRLRPKIMTVSTSLIGLVPIMWSAGVGADVMKPLAAPMIGGLFTSFTLELLIYPVVYYWWKWNYELKQGKEEVVL